MKGREAWEQRSERRAWLALVRVEVCTPRVCVRWSRAGRESGWGGRWCQVWVREVRREGGKGGREWEERIGGRECRWCVSIVVKAVEGEGM